MICLVASIFLRIFQKLNCLLKKKMKHLYLNCCLINKDYFFILICNKLLKLISFDFKNFLIFLRKKEVKFLKVRYNISLFLQSNGSFIVQIIILFVLNGKKLNIQLGCL